MAIQDLKFKESDFVGKDVSSLPDQIEGQAEFVKARIDNVPKNMIALGRFNGLIDEVVKYYARKGGEAFTGNISAPKMLAEFFSSPSAAVPMALLSNALYVKNYANTAYAPIYAGMIVSSDFLKPVLGLVTPGEIQLENMLPRIKCTNTSNWLEFWCNGGIASKNGAGTQYVQMVASSFVQQSSGKEKKIICECTQALEKLCNTRFFEYERADGCRQIGMVVEDESTPEDVIRTVTEEKNTKTRSTAAKSEKFIDLYSFISMTAQSLKELREEKNKEISELKKENEALKALLVSKGVCTQEEIDGLEV